MSNAIQPLTEGYLYRRSAIKLHPGSRNSRSLCICVSFRYPSQAGDYISLKPIVPTRRRKISGDLPLRRHKRVVRDVERRAVFLKTGTITVRKWGRGARRATSPGQSGGDRGLHPVECPQAVRDACPTCRDEGMGLGHRPQRLLSVRKADAPGGPGGEGDGALRRLQIR